MLWRVVIFCALFCGALAAIDVSNRIVGGTPATLGEVPYIVSVRGQNRHGCGGSIISDKYVLTAAHCVYNWTHRPDLFSVQYGVLEITEKEPNVMPVKKITMHEDYVHEKGYPNDVAVMEIDGQFKFNENVKPVSLPNPFQDPGSDVDALLAGWGLDQTGGHINMFLHKVTIFIFNEEYCASSNANYDSDVHLCAGVREGGKGQCTMDSGGPLTVDGMQFGIVSWSIKPCASPGNPGYFTKVTKYRNWIRLHTGI